MAAAWAGARRRGGCCELRVVAGLRGRAVAARRAKQRESPRRAAAAWQECRARDQSGGRSLSVQRAQTERADETTMRGLGRPLHGLLGPRRAWIAQSCRLHRSTRKPRFIGCQDADGQGASWSHRPRLGLYWATNPRLPKPKVMSATRWVARRALADGHSCSARQCEHPRTSLGLGARDRGRDHRFCQQRPAGDAERQCACLQEVVRSVDVHQHLWPEAVLRVLERRSAAPRARWIGRALAG